MIAKSYRFHPLDGVIVFVCFVIAAILLSFFDASSSIVTLDTHSYLSVFDRPGLEFLKHMRTVGYKIFLVLAATLGFGESSIAVVQLMCGLVALLLFYGCSAFAFDSRRIAAVMVLSVAMVMFADPMFVRWLGPDFLCYALLAVLGGVLLVYLKTSNLLVFTVAAIVVLLLYHLRPAYLFAVPLALVSVCLGCWLKWRGWLHVAIVSALVIGPFCAYVALRHSYTGEASLVSFDGYASVVFAFEAFRVEPQKHRITQEQQQFADFVEECRRTKDLKPAFIGNSFDHAAYDRSYTGLLFGCIEPYFQSAASVETYSYSINKKLKSFSAQIIAAEGERYLKFLYRRFKIINKYFCWWFDRQILAWLPLGLGALMFVQLENKQQLKHCIAAIVLMVAATIGASLQVIAFSPLEIRFLIATHLFALSITFLSLLIVKYLYSSVLNSKRIRAVRLDR